MTEIPAETKERVYEWEQMEIGHDAPVLTKEITQELITNFASSVQDESPVYSDGDAARAEGFAGIIAPPSMLFQIAPMRRLDIMHARGYISPEEKKVNPRATPFTGADINFLPVPIELGDVITSVSRIASRWESRSGNRFVSFGITAHNPSGQKVLDYYYTVLWEYSKGQKARPADAAAVPRPTRPERPKGALIGSHTSFAEINSGDTLPGLDNSVTQDLIDDYFHLNSGGGEVSPTALLHVDPKFAESTVFSGTTQGGPHAVAYMVRMLSAGLGLKRLMNGTTFTERALEPVRPGDDIAYVATVLDKREENDRKIVEFEITGTNQLGQTTAAAKAVVNWDLA